MKLPTLEAPRLNLRWLSTEDAPALFDLFSHPDVARYWSRPAMTERAQAEALVRSIQQHFTQGDLFQWGLTLANASRVIGTCTLASIDRSNRRAELGFALHPDHWGQGLMKEALQVLIDHAFGALNMHRLEADIDPRNTASLRLCERLGFTREGYLRERWIVAGEWCDTVLYGLLQSDR